MVNRIEDFHPGSEGNKPMQRYEKTLPRNPGCPVGIRVLLGAAAVLVPLAACSTPAARTEAPPDPMPKTPVEEGIVEIDQTLDEFMERVRDSRHKAWLLKFKRSFSDTDRFSITEREDCFEITVSHRSSDGYTGGAEAYRMDKRSGKVQMLWHEHPMRMPGIEERILRRDSGGGEGADTAAQEFTIRGVRGTTQVGAYSVQLLGVTLEVSDEGHAINLSLRLVDAAGAVENLYMSVPALPRTGEARCRFGVLTLTGVDDLDSNFYRSPENITWHFEFRRAGQANETGGGIPWIHRSGSMILDSKLIFEFTCESLTPSFNIDDMPSGYNSWSLTGRIRKIYKGNLGNIEGGKFETEVVIYIGPVISRPSGIWFGIDPFEIPQPGESWVVFCSPGKEYPNPEDLLRGKGEGCTASRTREVKEDLELTARVFAGPSDLKHALELARQNVRTAGPLFFSFLWEHFGEAVENDPDAYEQLMAILEHPALSGPSRTTLIHDLEAFFSLRDGSPGIRKSADRFIVTLFRLLEQKDPGNGDLQRNLVGTYIPNMLGIGSGLTKRSAAQVFSGFSKDRAEVIKSLKASPHSMEAGMLLSWIQVP